jgi:hypothetical protein
VVVLLHVRPSKDTPKGVYWVIENSHNGVQRTTMIYYFFLFCKANSINPEVWLNDVLLHINDTKKSELINLLPNN